VAVTGSHRSGADSPLDRRLQSIRVTDPSHETAAGRRSGGIDTVSTSFDTVSSADSRVIAGLPTDRGSFTGLLGFGLARHSSPVTLTFRHPHADAPTDTPFDSPSDGSPDAAVSSALQDRSAVAADQDRPPRVADTTMQTLHRLPPHSPSTKGSYHQIAQIQQSEPLTKRSTDALPTARPSAQFNPTHRAGSQRPRRTTPGQSTVHRLSVGIHSQPSVTLTDSAQSVPNTHPVGSATARNSVDSQRAGRPRRLQSDLRYRSIEQDRPSHFGGLSGPVTTADGFVDIGVEFESRTHGSYDRPPRRTVAAVDHGQPPVDTVQPLHNSQSAISVRTSTGWPSTADQHSTGSQWQPGAFSSLSSATREPTTQPAERITAGTVDSGPPLQAVGSTPVSAHASGLSTTRRRYPVPEQSRQAQTRQPRRASDSFRSIRSTLVSGRSPAITSNAARPNLDHGRPERDYSPRLAATTSAQQQVSDLSTMRVVGQSSRTTPGPFTARTVDQSPTNTLGPLTAGGVGSRSGTSTPYTQTPSTVSTLRLPVAESSESLSHYRVDDRSRWHQPSARWHHSSSSTMPTRVVDPSVPVASGGSRSRVASSGIRRFDSDRVFATADRAAPSDQKSAIATATDPHDRRQPANTVPPQPERPAVSGRRPTNSQRRRSRKHTRGAVFSPTLHTRVPRGSAGAPTGTDAASRLRPFSSRLPRTTHPRSPRRGLAGSAAANRADRLLDSPVPLSQQSRQRHRLQPSARSWTGTDSRSAATDLQRQPESMRSGLEPDRRPRRESPFSLAPFVASDLSAEPRGVDSVRISRWPLTATQSRFKKPPRQRAATRSQSTLTAAQPTAGAGDLSWPTHDMVYTGDSPAAVAPTLTDGIPTDSRRPTLSRRSTRPSPPQSHQDSPTVRSQLGPSVSVDWTARSRIPTGSQTGLTVTPETTAATTARSRLVAGSHSVPSSRVAGRLAPPGHIDSPATEPPTETDGPVAGSAPPISPRHSLRQSAVVSRHPLTTVKNDTGPTAGASGSTTSRSVAPRQRLVQEGSRSADRLDRHQLLSSPSRRPLRSDTELFVSTPQTTGIDHTAISLDVSDTIPTALATVRRSPPTTETDVDRSRLPTRQDVAGRSAAPDSPPTTLSWLSQPIDRPIRRSRQSTAARGESEPTSRLSESAGFRPRRSAGGVWQTTAFDPSSRPRHRNRSVDGPHPAQSSRLASVSQHSGLLRSDVGIADGVFPALDHPFKKSRDIASDFSSLSTGRSWMSQSANSVSRAVAPRDDSNPGMTPRTHAPSRLDSGSSSLIAAGSTPTVVDREPSDIGYDASVLSVAAAPRTDAESSDHGRRPDDTTGDRSRVDVRRRPRSVRSSSLTHATGAESSTATESESPNTGRKQPPTDESDGETSRPRLTFKNPPSQRGSDAAHDTAGGRGTTDRHHRRERSAATDARAGSQEMTQPQSDRQGRTTRRSDPFEPVDRPDRQPTPTTDQESVGQSADTRQDTGRRSHDGLGDSISGASLAYDADVDRVVETLYRRLERKLRIERERTGF